MQNEKLELSESGKAYHAKIMAIIDEVEKVIIGKRRELTLLLTAMLSGGHVLIEDVPGVGKTTLAAALAKAAGLSFNRAQFTPDVTASDITGFNLYNRASERFEFRSGIVMCNILLADEINRASPKTQSSLLEAMEEKHVSVDGTTYNLPDPFMVIATQNPSGYVGTYPLPEAQMDRFFLKISMGYPTESEEISIIAGRRGQNPLEAVSAVSDLETITNTKKYVSEINVDGAICQYIVSLIQATRKTPDLALGASPRASIALMKLAQAYAFIRGRDYVLAEDVSNLFFEAAAHRVLLSQDARLNRINCRDIFSEIIKNTEVPYKSAK